MLALIAFLLISTAKLLVLLWTNRAGTLERLAATLSVVNVRNYLEDLPQDVDVVAVEPVQHRVRQHRYLG